MVSRTQLIFVPPSLPAEPELRRGRASSLADHALSSPESGTPGIALVGTSYSAARIWSFESQLKGALGADIVNYAQEGHGPFVPMRSFMKKVEVGEVEVKAVIWEIPIRYLDDDTKTDIDGPSSSSV